MPSDLRLSRRQMLQQSAASLLAAGLWPGILDAADADAPGDFHFLVVNDLHSLDKRCQPWFEAVVKQMKAHQEKIDFCLIVGDLADKGTTEQLEAVRTIFEGLDMPLHAVVGNHDYLTQTDRKSFEEVFPKSINYQFEHKGWQFLGLDSTDGLRSAAVSMPKATLTWLDDTVPKLDKKRPTVMFTHFPLGEKVITRLINAEGVLGRFKEHNLQAVYSGHFHGFTERQAGATTLTTNRCCAFSKNNHDNTKEKGYFLCHAKDGKIVRAFVECKPA